MPTRCFENEPVFAVVTHPRGQALFMRGYDAGAGMRQTIFSRVRPAVDGGSAIECACACSPAMSASPGCHEQWDAAGGPPQSGPSIGLSAIRYHATSGLPCRTNLPTCGAIPQFDASRFNWRRPQVLLAVGSVATVAETFVTQSMKKPPSGGFFLSRRWLWIEANRR